MQVEIRRQRVSLRRQAGKVEPAPRLGHRLRTRQGGRAEHRGEYHIIEHAAVGEGTRDLVGAGEPEPCDAMRGPALDRLTLEYDASAVKLVMPAHHIDQRRLAGAIGSEQAEDLSTIDIQIDPVERLNAGEALADVAKVKQPGAAAAKRTRAHGRRKIRALCGQCVRRGRRAHRASATHKQGSQNAVGHEQNDRDENDTDGCFPGEDMVARGRGIANQRDRSRADRRTGPVTRSSENTHEHNRERQGNGKGFGHGDV